MSSPHMVTVKSVMHGQLKEGESPPPFHLYYTSDLDPRRIKAVAVSKRFGREEATRPLMPQKVRLVANKFFYEHLRESIEEKGFLNPILCWNFKSGLHVLYGTSRAWLAQQMQKPIPAFIVDFSLKWEEGELITEKEQALSKFGEEPDELIFQWNYFNFVNERFSWDPIVVKMCGKPY